MSKNMRKCHQDADIFSLVVGRTPQLHYVEVCKNH